MSRIQACFEALRKKQQTGLIPYITAGDPNPSLTVPIMHELVRAGADIIELGVPFSDPMADGPAIQKACERALVHGVSLSDVLSMVSQFRDQDTHTPVVLMGYLNPIEIMGVESFSERAHRAGLDGVLTVDLPPEESDELLCALEGTGIDPVFLLAPTSSPERISQICGKARGFVYYVSVKGVTGSTSLDIENVAGKITRIRERTDLPVGVGFGIRDPATAAGVAQFSDAVVVGSALVGTIEQHSNGPNLLPTLYQQLSEIRIAINQPRNESQT